MNLIVAFVAVLIVFAAIATKQNGLLENGVLPMQRNELGEVLSREDEKEDEVEVEVESIKLSITPTPTKVPTPKPTLTLSDIYNISDFVYPNSVVTEQKNNELKLKSNDGSDVITNWYKEKIKSLGMSVNSFVVTKANDKVLNKLVGAGSKGDIRITIEKDEGSYDVFVTVSK